MALSLHEINDIADRLKRAAPHLEDHVNALANAARGNRAVQWVEVTYPDGEKQVMDADDYQHRTAFDLKHSHFRVLSPAEAERLRGRA